MGNRFYIRTIYIMCCLCLGCSRELMISNPKRPVITPTQLQVHGDKITFNVNTAVPAGTLSPTGVYRLVPRFTYENSEITLEPITFNGSRRAQNIEKNYFLDYLSDMDDGQLAIHGDFVDSKSGERAAYRLPLSSTKGVITTSRLLIEEYMPAYAELDPYYYEKDTLRLDYEFALGGSELLQNKVNGQLNKVLDSLILSDRIILGSRVIGTHSPVGSDAVNKRLSEQRAQEVKKLYDEKIVNHPSSELDKLELELQVEFNSWDIFIEKLKATALWERDKEVIAEITAKSSDYETVKSRLLVLPDIARISREVFPKLQMSRLEIVYGRTIRDEKQLNATVAQILDKDAADVMLFEDVLAIAQQESNRRKRIRLYETAVRLGESWELYNDWAATYLDSYTQWNDDRAQSHLNKVYDLLKRSIKIEKTEEALINLGITNSIAGRSDLATTYFDEAKVFIKSSAKLGNFYYESRGVAELKSGQYNQAIASFSKTEKQHKTLAYNRGLANLLAGKYDPAIASLSAALDLGSDSTRTLYTQAIAANKSLNRNLTVSCLSTTFRINPRYNDFFHGDYEFENINKVLFPRYPDSLKTRVRDFKRLKTYQLPVFAYPVPSPSFLSEIESEELSSLETYGQVGDFLINTLFDLGWKADDLTIFEMPGEVGGFAVLTRLEQTDEFGQSAFAPDRWEPEVKIRSGSSWKEFLGNYSNSLTYAKRGAYRLIVFIVTNEEVLAISDSDSKLPAQVSLKLLEAGSNKLSDSLRNVSYKDHRTSLLVYEFKKGSDKVELVSKASTDHYTSSGLKEKFTP